MNKTDTVREEFDEIVDDIFDCGLRKHRNASDFPREELWDWVQEQIKQGQIEVLEEMLKEKVSVNELMAMIRTNSTIANEELMPASIALLKLNTLKKIS